MAGVKVRARSWLAAGVIAVSSIACGRVGLVHQEKHPEPDRPLLVLPPTFSEYDDDVVQPAEPLLDTTMQRATVVLHTGGHACAGVLVDARVVASSRRCFDGLSAGLTELKDSTVDVASADRRWTSRALSHALIPECTREQVDLVFSLLAEPVTWVAPLAMASAPGPGADLELIGFGECNGERAVRQAHVVARDALTLTIDHTLCHGEGGEPVLDHDLLVGVVTPISAGHDTAVVRLDSVPARALFEQARAKLRGEELGAPVSCASE